MPARLTRANVDLFIQRADGADDVLMDGALATFGVRLGRDGRGERVPVFFTTERLRKRVVDRFLDVAQGRDTFLRCPSLAGFAVRIRPGGKAVYVLRYRTKSGQERRMTIARVGELTIDEAREQAEQARAKVRKGEDPAGNDRAKRTALTFGEVAERWFVEHAKPNKAPLSVVYDRATLDKILLPKLGGVKVEDIAEEHVEAVKRTLGDRRVRFNRVRALLSAILNWSIKRRLRKAANPVANVDRYRENGRTRFLSAAELVRLGSTLKDAETAATEHPSMIGLVRLITLTGCRRDEVRCLRWGEVDLEQGVLRLPGTRVKERENKVIALGEPAMELLRNARAAAGEVDPRAFVLPGTQPNKPFAGHLRAWRRIRDKAELGADTRLHDLRHTVATWAVGSKIGTGLVQQLLGHRSVATTAKYVHRDLDPLREAADLVSGRIAAHLMSGNIVGV